MKVIRDSAYREIEVVSDGDDELTDEQAQTFAEQHLRDEGADRDWDFDGVERISPQRVVVKFVGW